jgi:hypothetical protein
MTRRIREALQDGPLAAEDLTERLGISRVRLHSLIHKSGSRIVRVDLTPECGRFARPVYAVRTALTVRS